MRSTADCSSKTSSGSNEAGGTPTARATSTKRCSGMCWCPVSRFVIEVLPTPTRWANSSWDMPTARRASRTRRPNST